MNVEKKLDSTFLLNIGKYQGHEFANSYLTFLLLSVSKSFNFNYDWVAQFEIVKLLCCYVSYLCPEVEFDFDNLALPCLHSIISGRGRAGRRST